MLPQTQDKLNRIRQTSGVLRRVCKALLLLVALLFAAASIGIVIGQSVTISFPEFKIPVEPLSLANRLVLMLVLAFSMGVIAKGLYHLDLLFFDYSRGEIFTKQAARQIRQLGITALLWAAANIVSSFVAVKLLGSRFQGSFSLHIDSVFIGLAVIVVSWFMDAAAEMREENELTI